MSPWTLVLCCILTSLFWGGTCRDGDAGEIAADSESTAETTSQTIPFDLYWPLVDPSVEKPKGAVPLLTGHLTVRPRGTGTSNARMVVSLSLARSETDQHRQYWNTRLAYRDYDWMRHVRVWDEDKRWLYPNLAFLFNLHGTDRLERYGGWDPGKHVDNDFGAVLIRKYDAAGVNEQGETKDKPLVSARWYPTDVKDAGKQTIVHRVKSDDFTIHLAANDQPDRGRIRVWFVYGDFFGHPAPRNWPQEPEFNGGTLAFFEIDWQHQPRTPLGIVIAQKVPQHTAFAWRQWVGRNKRSEKPIGRARLKDH